MIRRVAPAVFALCLTGFLPGAARADDPPAAARAHYERAKDKQAKGDLDGALADYTAAIEADPKYAWAFNNRGNVKDKKGDADGAIADYTRALELDPSYGTAWFNRGVLRDTKGDLDGAIADFTAAIELDATDAQALNNRGDAMDRKGDLDAALADFTAAIEADPRYARAYANRASLRAERGDTDGALADYTRAIELDGRYANAYAGRGIGKLRLRDYDGAVRDLSKALDLSPTRDYSRFFRFLAQVLSGMPEASAVAALKTGRAAVAPLPADAFAAKLDSFLEGALTADALLALADAAPEAARAGRQCEACFYAGMVAWMRGDKPKAVGLLERCVATKKTAYAEHITARAVLAWPR